MASLQDVAEAAGVSAATVSVVLSDKSHQIGIAKSTQAKVRKIARKLDYRPHYMARGLRTGLTYTIGLLFSSPKELLYAELLAEIQSLLRPHGYAGLCAFWDDDASAAEAFRAIHDRGVEAMITSHDDLSLIPSGMPATLLYQSDAVHDSLTYNRSIAIDLVVQYLLDLGHRRFGGVDLNPVTHKPLLEAALGSYCSDTTLTWTYHPTPDYLTGARICLAEILNLPSERRPTALICRNDTVAMLTISEAGRAGLRVPEDISVVGSDAVSLGTLASPPLTSVGISPQKVARMAIEMTLKRISKPELPLQKIVLKPQLVKRASCAPPPCR